MKLSQYIKKTLKELIEIPTIGVNFEVGLDIDMKVNDKSKNRISFTVINNEWMDNKNTNSTRVLFNWILD